MVGIVVALFGLLEFATKYNIIYEVFLSTPYYERYLNCSRIMSTQYHPAVLATYFMLILPFSIFLLFNNRNKTELLLGVISSMIILGGIILTFTRAVFVATFILLSIYLLVRHRKIYFIFLSFLILFLILTIPITKHFQTFKTFERFDITSPKQERAIMYRLKRFPTAFKIWKLQPVTGVGIGNFRYLFDKYHSEGGVEYEFKIPDNMYLSILSETGILGLLTLVYLVFSTIILAYKKIKVLVSSDKQFLLLILCGFIGYLINMLSYDMFYWHMPLYFFSLYIGIIKSYL